MATYAITDLHGMYNLWKGIQEYLNPDDILYCLGDAIDRGPRGFEIFMEMLNDPRVIYIKGNHEKMMYDAFFSEGVEATKCYEHWMKNGGQDTLNNIEKLGLNLKETLKYISKIRKMSTSEIYVNSNNDFFYLTHAGTTPNQKYFAMSFWDREYYDIWNRKHFLDEWPKDYQNAYVIHGHTPVQVLTKMIMLNSDSYSLPLKYCDGHKINLDSGAFSTNIVALYNLDKNDIEIIFKGE